jgi:DNA-binding response OmpR family regulator
MCTISALLSATSSMLPYASSAPQARATSRERSWLEAITPRISAPASTAARRCTSPIMPAPRIATCLAFSATMPERLVPAVRGLPATVQNDRVTAARILVVEDSNAIRVPVVTALSAQGFELASAADGSDLERLLPSIAPDLVILDVMLPGRDGFELLQVVRRTSTAAVLMLTARDSLADRLHGLIGGADDYLIKPFAMAELVARIHAVLRRSRPGGSSISIADLVINDDATLVQRCGESLHLTDTERRLLGYLAAHRDRVVSKTQILTGVWGYDGFDENVVEVHVSSLRRKLEARGRSRLVHTVRGRGYLLGTTA